MASEIPMPLVWFNYSYHLHNVHDMNIWPWMWLHHLESSVYPACVCLVRNINIRQPEVLTISYNIYLHPRVHQHSWENEWVDVFPIEPTGHFKYKAAQNGTNNSAALMLPKLREPNLSGIAQSPKCLCVPRLLCDRSRNVPAILFLNKLEGN